uniref:Tyrosine-protein phosphatase non-receptor type 13 n=1 Tax=Cacopsylla melanoneura TaxID=428564 RepID=A0A8D8XTC1_9HEMI
MYNMYSTCPCPQSSLTSMDTDDVSVAEVLTLRNCQGLSEIEIWSILCQSAQSLQDLFLAYDERKKYDPIITLDSLLITSQGRVLIKPYLQGCFEPKDMRFLAPEFDPTLPQPCSEIQMEKMWLYSLGICAKHMFLSTLTVSRNLSDIVLQLTRKDPNLRCSLLTLLNVISDYCQQKDQSQPFCSVIMEIHTFAKSAKPSTNSNTLNKINRKRSSSYVDINILTNSDHVISDKHNSAEVQKRPIQRAPSRLYKVDSDVKGPNRQRLSSESSPTQTCVGPEFVIRSTRQPSIIHIGDIKTQNQRKVMIILLNGHKLEVTCDASITAGQLFEVVVQNEYITENFTLGLAALVSGDFVFLPSDSRLNRVLPNPTTNKCPYLAAFTLYLRVKFYLPSLRGIRCVSWKHQLYLQLRSNVLSRQLRCDSVQLFTLAGLALQAEFGDYNEQKHGGCGDYFLLEHYLPESSITSECESPLIAELQARHRERQGLAADKAEDLFIVYCQQLAEYGTHFYSSHLVCKDLKTLKGEVWLGVNLHGVFFCTKRSACRSPTQLFVWSNIKKLEYQKHAFCLITQVKGVKFKFKMDNHKSYYVFHLASLHHKFFCKLRLEMSLKSLSDEFGVPVISKSMLDSKMFYVLKEDTKTKKKKSPSPKQQGLSHTTNRAVLQPLNTNCVNTQRSLCNKQTSENYLSRSNTLESLGKENRSLGKENRSLGKENRSLWKENRSLDKEIRSLKPGTMCNIGETVKTLPRTLMKCKRNRDKENSRVANVAALDKENTLSMSQGNLSVKSQQSQLTPKLPRRFTPNPSKLFSSTQSLHSLSLGLRASQSSLHSLSRPMTPAPEVYILNASMKSTGEGLHFDPHESISDSLACKFENLSWTEDDRLLTTVRLKKSPSGCLGVEVTEGINGGVYIQSVLPGGPADRLGNIHPGDRIVSVNGKDLLSVQYKKALLLIQREGSVLELVLSQPPPGMESPSLPLRRPRSVCTDMFTHQSHSHIEQAYLRSIRYETAPDEDRMESVELPSHSHSRSSMGLNSVDLPSHSLSRTSTGLNRKSSSNGELTSSLPRGNKSLSFGELFHATQSFII